MPDDLRQRLQSLPASPFAEGALVHLREASAKQGLVAEMEGVLADERLAAFLGSALGDCPYLCDLAAKDVLRLLAIVEEAPEERVARLIREISTGSWTEKSAVMSALRRAKQDVALTLGLADLGRAIDLETVTGGLSDLADAALDAALRFSLSEAERQGRWRGALPAESGLAILAMGKHGARELNYSSDIDIILIYDPERPGVAEGIEPSVFWVRIVRQLVALLQERTADSYVFRVDLRLRPDPGATPLALSLPAALIYYESMGQNWERAAMIKARVCAGDHACGETFLSEVAPFIWRKYLDFAAIADIHSIKRQMHAHRGHGAIAVAGHDIKRGRGGIREIEFFAQTQQLIAGGRDRALRGRATRPMLSGLAEKGWFSGDVRDQLDGAYVFLRTVEHRLQMVRDEQTHLYPTALEERARIARLMGFEDPEAFEKRMRATLTTVARFYSELFENAPELDTDVGSLVFTGGEDDPETLETLRRMQFEKPERVTETIRSWHFGRFPAMRSTKARERLTEITPGLLTAMSRGGNPDAALGAFDALLRALPAGAQLFSLLASNPALLDMLVFVLGAAPRLAETFARRPHVVDALINPASLAQDGTLEVFRAQLHEATTASRDHEDALNRVRLFVGEQRFMISVRLITGQIASVDAAEIFSDLAQAALCELLDLTRADFRRQYGVIPGGCELVLALGRLGSREMTATSDLDLLIIYDHDAGAAISDGARGLPPSQYYARFTQRLVSALSAPTSEGIAYFVDLRLRPSGRSGPLATHVDAFERYQREEAWTWEHMALSRARPVAGDTALCLRVDQAIAEVTAQQRERGKLVEDVASMRSRVEDARGAGAWDLKTGIGSIMDCEFIAQLALLAGLPKRDGETTSETLVRAGETGALALRDADLLAFSDEWQTAILQAMRIVGDTLADPSAAPEDVKRLIVKLAAGATARWNSERALPSILAEETFFAQDPAGAGERLAFDVFQSALAAVQSATREAYRKSLAFVAKGELHGSA
ncbi:glutamate-ammonia-ligase adenylyltransferase [Faunimonas pinastri]|uniref:Bifunctional glutamine synthetase adenylyltransferase/adenylyl-removing enzyme n=1 Tax=Faunimonas pinastri TaxID=1855383 RepID=A0A1H9L0G5_9HYPH|nr:bifunctional [glutamine synthetase] adenylyltransferase/[glutamine synthetase]-adenylyl-L-tyrosine phosphorylase [Faunimonas pinastri]SER04637.1 glutamate-ammonia-ligase adenylyltransferase [Faunimonas pinastri]